MPSVRKLAPCLWFDNQAEEAARYYVGIFKNSKIGRISRYSEAGREVHRRPPGSVMTVEFELDGQPFTALNGGPTFKFNEAISFQIDCETSRKWTTTGTSCPRAAIPKAQQCGWVKDKFGLSWQVVPRILPELITDPRSAQGGSRDGSHAADEEDRHRGAEASGVRRAGGLEGPLTGL